MRSPSGNFCVERASCVSLRVLYGVLAAMASASLATPSLAQDAPPNIVVIMADDIGWSNIGVYNQGIMAGRTPHLDQMANEGMRFTDYYAEASCTAGRANFITGEIPIRTGLTTSARPARISAFRPRPSPSPTALKGMGYETGQFGKNHLGDLNEYPANGARVRRVLRLSLPPRRDGGPVRTRTTRRTC